MKTINLELSKRLANYLDSVKTEYSWIEKSEPIKWNIYWTEFKHTWKFFVWKKFMDRADTNFWKEYKTLTLEEAIEFCPKRYKQQYSELTWTKNDYRLIMVKLDKWYCFKISDEFQWGTDKSCCWKTILQAIEKMLEYLLDNNLLWIKQDNK